MGTDLTIGHELHHQGRVGNVGTAHCGAAMFLTFRGDGAGHFVWREMVSRVSKQT